MSAITRAGLDGLQWHPWFTIEKYSPDQARFARGKADSYRLHPRFGKYVPGFLPGDWLRSLFPYPDLGTLHGEGNGVTAGGLDNLAMVLTGTGGHPLAPGRVAFGVGTHPGEFDIEQVRLGGEDGENPGRTWYRPMDHGYPQPAVGGIEGQATFAEDEACFDWHEWCWAAGPVAPVQHHALHHSYSGQGGLMINRKGSEAGYGLKEPGVAWVFRVHISLR